MLYLILTISANTTPKVVIPISNNITWLKLISANIPVILGTIVEAKLEEVNTIPVILPLLVGNNSDIEVNAHCNTPPAAEKPITNAAIIQVVVLGNIQRIVNIINEING